MGFTENFSLFGLNTFKVNVQAKYFSEFESEDQLKALLSITHTKKLPVLILGSGSNVLFTKNFEGFVLLNKLKGIEIINEDKDSIRLKCYSGELWDDIVNYTAKNNWGGIENLSLIPGTAGAAPIQNIGAYGVELSNVLVSLEAIEITTGKTKTFSNRACLFGYRDSIFKNEFKNQYVITSIVLQLKKNPKVNIQYATLKNYFSGENNISISQVREKVIKERKSKLPDPEKLGNAGSFFKNPVLSKEKTEYLLEKFGEIPIFETKRNQFKVSAGWLIEKCGFKGIQRGDVGIYRDHALVLVNYGGESGPAIMDLANEIMATVKNKFEIELIPEVNIL